MNILELEQLNKKLPLNTFDRVREIKGIFMKTGDTTILDFFSQQAITKNDAELAFRLAFEFGKKVDIHALENVVLNSNSTFAMRSFMCIKGCHFDVLMKKIFKSNDIDSIYYMAVRHPKKVDLKKCQGYIIRSKDPEYNWAFPTSIKDIDISRHEQIIMQSKDPYYCFDFARDVKGANILKLKEIVDASGNEKVIKRFEKEIMNVSKYKKAIKEYELSHKQNIE